MPQIVALRNKISPNTLIIGNGDVESLEDAKQKAKKYGCDGVMIGRGIFGNPWFFSGCKGQSLKNSKRTVLKEPSIQKRLEALVEHTKLFEKELDKYKSFALMKKHFKAYVNGFDGAKELRIELMEAKNSKEVEKTIKDFLKKI